MLGKEVFVKNDWDHMHDCILNRTWETTRKNLDRVELEEIFDALPEDLQEEAFEWGMNDSSWRDRFGDWYESNMM